MTAPLCPYYLVIDVEATCDRGGALPPADSEIIEIGAVLVRAADFGPAGEFQTFVRPRGRPRLTAFCTELTSIAQADVDRAPSFPAALAALAAFVGGREALFCSWGDYDRVQFGRDARRHRAALPFGDRHLNLKARFSEALGEGRAYGMAGALRRVGLALEGTHHRGIDDARNIARLLPYALGARGPRGDAAPRYGAPGPGGGSRATGAGPRRSAEWRKPYAK
jgi:inhibitor of KinA sporulation pathway (predicted exonuclease)